MSRGTAQAPRHHMGKDFDAPPHSTARDPSLKHQDPKVVMFTAKGGPNSWDPSMPFPQNRALETP
eukprot:6046874-Pyramimonas_sp.AAC.1